MKLAHYVEMRVFSKEGEDEGQIINKIKELFPFDFKEEKIKLDVRTAYGFENKKIHILTVSVNKEKQTRAVLENLMSNLSQEQKDLILRQLESRLDEKLHFYLRLDKEKLLNNEYWIIDEGNCFHLTIAIAAYPHKREKAAEIINKILGLNKI